MNAPDPGFVLRTFVPAMACTGVAGVFYGALAAGHGGRVPGAIEVLFLVATAALALVAYCDLRDRQADLQLSIAVVVCLLPPIGLLLWVHQAWRHRRGGRL